MPPPRKRARAGPSSQTPTTSSPAPTNDAAPTVLDPWTPSQESALFKALIKAKPTGIHKHMHMLTISRSVRDAYYVSRSSTQPHAIPKHLQSKGIWAKLNKLYDLPALDEREESYRLSGPRFKRGRDGVAREVESDEDEDGDEVDFTNGIDFCLAGSRESPDREEDVAEKWDGELEVIALGGGDDADFAQRMLKRRSQPKGEQDESEGEDEEDEAMADAASEDVEGTGNDEDEDEEEDEGDDNGDTEDTGRSKSRTRAATARTSTRRAGAPRRSSRASGAAESEDAGGGDEDNEDSNASSPPAKATRRTVRGSTARRGRKRKGPA